MKAYFVKSLETCSDPILNSQFSDSELGGALSNHFSITDLPLIDFSNGGGIFSCYYEGFTYTFMFFGSIYYKDIYYEDIITEDGVSELYLDNSRQLLLAQSQSPDETDPEKTVETYSLDIKLRSSFLFSKNCRVCFELTSFW